MEDLNGQAWSEALVLLHRTPSNRWQTKVVNRSLGTLLRVLIKKNLKGWEDCIPHAEFAYNRAKHSSTSMSPFMVVYGFEPPTTLDLLPLPLHERTNMDIAKHADIMKKIHEDTRATLERQALHHAMKMNKHKKQMMFEEGDLVWIHLRKERFPKEKNSKLKPRGDGPFKVLRRIGNNAYIIDIPTDKYNVSNTFNVADLSPYHGDDKDLETRSTLSQEGGVDTGWPSDPSQAIPPSAPSGPMTRARAKLLHDKVNSLLSSCDFNTSLDGMLLHAPTLCILSYDSMGDRQDKAAKETGAKIKCGEAPGETGDETGEPVLPPKPADDSGARTGPPDSPPKPFRPAETILVFTEPHYCKQFRRPPE